MKHLVIVPTFNEKENITSLIETVMSLSEFDILVVDDGSPDGTAQLVKKSQELFPNKVHLIEREGKLGLGSAYIRGFKFGISRGYDYLYEMDADFSHDPNDLLRLKDSCINRGADVSIGSRYTKGGGFINWPKDRILISKGGALYVRILTFMPIKDPTAGFICYSSKVLKSIDLDKVGLQGYGFQIEMKYVAWKMGFKLAEVPIIFKDRELGTSKMNPGIIKEAIGGVIRLRMRNVRKFYSAKPE